MFERFTERARQVVVLASEEARLLKHDYIGTEHLLLGLLGEDDALAAEVLASFGVALKPARTQAVRIVGSGDAASSDQLPFTPRAKRVLESALEEADPPDGDVRTEHMLLGILRERDGVARQVLLAFDTDPEGIRDELLTAMERGPTDTMRATLTARRETVATLIAAAEQRDEVIAIITQSESRHDALEGLAALSGIAPGAAEQVLDMRLGRLQPDEVERLRQELELIDERLRGPR